MAAVELASMTEPLPAPAKDARDLSDRLELLVAAVPSLIGELSLEGVLQRVADLAPELIGARYAAVGMLAPDGRTLATFTTHGISAVAIPFQMFLIASIVF